MILPDLDAEPMKIEEDEIIREVHQHKEEVAEEFEFDPKKARRYFQQVEQRLRATGWQIQNPPAPKAKSS